MRADVLRLVGLVVRVKGRRRDAEVVLDPQRHAGRRVVLELGQRDVDVAVDVGVVQVVGREEAAAPGHLHLVVLLSLAQVARVLVLDGRLQGRQSVQVPAGVPEVRLEWAESGRCTPGTGCVGRRPGRAGSRWPGPRRVDMIGSAAGRPSAVWRTSPVRLTLTATVLPATSLARPPSWSIMAWSCGARPRVRTPCSGRCSPARMASVRGPERRSHERGQERRPGDPQEISAIGHGAMVVLRCWEEETTEYPRNGRGYLQRELARSPLEMLDQVRLPLESALSAFVQRNSTRSQHRIRLN